MIRALCRCSAPQHTCAYWTWHMFDVACAHQWRGVNDRLSIFLHMNLEPSERIDYWGARCEPHVYRSFSAGLNDRSIYVSQCMPRHWCSPNLPIFRQKFKCSWRSLVASLPSYNFNNSTETVTSRKYNTNSVAWVQWHKLFSSTKAICHQGHTYSSSIDYIFTLALPCVM